MTKRTKYVVAPSPGKQPGWDTTKDGQKVGHHEKKADAVGDAADKARRQGNSQLVIKKEDGKIQEERTYGNDPYPPKG